MVAEMKTGVRLPDGTVAFSLLGRHREVLLADGQTVDVVLLANAPLPGGLPTIDVGIEAAILEPELGGTISRSTVTLQLRQ